MVNIAELGRKNWGR